MFIPAVPKPGASAKKFRDSLVWQGIRWNGRKNQPDGEMLKNGHLSDSR
jgi:hypothetical protein